MQNVDRRFLNGEEDAPGGSATEETLPNVAIQNVAFWGVWVGFGHGAQVEDSPLDTLKPARGMKGITGFEPSVSLADVIRREGGNDDAIRLHGPWG